MSLYTKYTYYKKKLCEDCINKDKPKTCEYPRTSTIDKEWQNIEITKRETNEAIEKRKNIEERKV